MIGEKTFLIKCFPVHLPEVYSLIDTNEQDTDHDDVDFYIDYGFRSAIDSSNDANTIYFKSFIETILEETKKTYFWFLNYVQNDLIGPKTFWTRQK